MISQIAATLIAALTLSSPSVSTDTMTVYAVAGGKKMAVLHACKNERFYPGTKDAETAPSLSPDGKWLVVTRVFPYEPHGRVDQSTVLLDVKTRRAYASSFFGARFGSGTPVLETWVPGMPATLKIVGSSKTQQIALPGPLKGATPPNRCS